MQQLIKIVDRLGTPSIPTLSRLSANKRDKLGLDSVLQSLSSFRVLLYLLDILIPIYFHSIRQSRSSIHFRKDGVPWEFLLVKNLWEGVDVLFSISAFVALAIDKNFGIQLKLYQVVFISTAIIFSVKRKQVSMNL